MKYNRSSLTALLLSLTLAASALLSCSPVSAIQVSAAEQSFNQSATASYDLNKDSTPDKIDFGVLTEEGADPESPYSGLYVNVNDSITSAVIGDWFYSYSYEFFEMGGKTFLLLKVSGDNDNGAKQLYSWEGGDFKLQRDINRDFKEYEGVSYHIDASVGKVQGQTLTMKVTGQFTGLAHAELKAVYNLKDGKLVDNDSTYTVIPRYLCWNQKTGKSGYRKYLTVKKSIQLYKDKKCSKKAKKLDPGKKIIVTKLYVGKNYSSYYVKGMGWYKAKNNSQMAEDYFEGLMFVG